MRVVDGALEMTPVLATKPKSYALVQLLLGAIPAKVNALNYGTACSREGDVIGCELICV